MNSAADQAEWLDRLDAELGNVRTAIAFSLTQPEPAPGLRLAASLHMYWAVRGHAAERVDVLRVLLDAPTAHGTTLQRARALDAAGLPPRQDGRLRGRIPPAAEHDHATAG